MPLTLTYPESHLYCLLDVCPQAGDLTFLILHLLTLKMGIGTSLVAQWLGIHLTVQGTRVRALVWEDPTCRGVTGPVCHNY